MSFESMNHITDGGVVGFIKVMAHDMLPLIYLRLVFKKNLLPKDHINRVKCGHEPGYFMYKKFEWIFIS